MTSPAAHYREINIRSVALPGSGRVRKTSVGDIDDLAQAAVECRPSFSALCATSLVALTGLLETLYSVFLPKGYPDSVSPDYLMFQTMDSVQARTFKTAHVRQFFAAATHPYGSLQLLARCAYDS